MMKHLKQPITLIRSLLVLATLAVCVLAFSIFVQDIPAKAKEAIWTTACTCNYDEDGDLIGSSRTCTTGGDTTCVSCPPCDKWQP